MEQTTHPTLLRLLSAAQANLKNVGNWADLSRAINEAPNTVSNWGKRGVPPGKVLALARKVGCAPEWISEGAGPISVASALDVDVGRLESGRGSPARSGNIVTPPRPIVAVDDDTPLSDDEIEVPRLTLKLSAGSGRLQWEIDEKGTPNRFRKSWCRKKHLRPEDLVTVVIDGDSMTPGVPNGASVTLDTKSTALRTGKRHAIDYLGEFFIKRLFRQPDGSILVRSDNPDKAIYPDWVVGPEHGDALRIIGRPVSIAADMDD
jgi:phage repressor protein C with HTH and peptisase S24 domain